MQHQSMSQHIRKRSQTTPAPQSPPETASARPKPPPIQTQVDAPRRPSGNGGPGPGQQYHNGIIGGHSAAATTAANAAFPRQLSPGLTSFQEMTGRDQKAKTERSKMKLFSKPKHIGISAYKDTEKKDRPLPSPNKMGPSGPSGLSRAMNASTTSLVDSLASGNTSMYTSSNASTSTLVPIDRQTTFEKEKSHKHHFLSRQKNKLKDKMDEHSLPLSSASSNSKPLDPNAPQSLYSFAPSSPGPSATFAKSVSGLDLRHGGRALREKKKEEKAMGAISFDTRKPDVERTDWAPTALSTSASHSYLEPISASSSSLFGRLPSSHGEVSTPPALHGFGLSNLTPEDAWDFLKAKLLIIFEGEELRMPVEDLNRLVSVHLQSCIQKQAPTIITEDLRDLLHTGFSSQSHALRNIPDDRLVLHLVEMWHIVFGTVLPYMQAVFLPLDLEFKGHGTLMSSRQAAEFWGVIPDAADDAFGNELDVRRIVLVAYRDTIILPRHASLKSTFSRLSLESINGGVELVSSSPDSVTGARPGTAASLDPRFASFNSQGSTLLADSEPARSRATSNTSAPELPTFAPPARRQPPIDSSQVTETVGRMLQCVSVLASVQSGDAAQEKMEELAKELKHNWLGRGRTGRNRRGFVGTRVQPVRQGGTVGREEGEYVVSM
ncbi:HbrB-like [Lasallia pustulata]|uniref:HbrB-like n=1 Tax=Lasallia pustulata TaxID=136370 RepID=A0A1W5CUW6_9LECA|nr:HbrB-like [Lasallia pustulata]